MRWWLFSSGIELLVCCCTGAPDRSSGEPAETIDTALSSAADAIEPAQIEPEPNQPTTHGQDAAPATSSEVSPPERRDEEDGPKIRSRVMLRMVECEGCASDRTLTALKRLTGKLQACHLEGLAKNPSLKARLEISLALREDGSVKKVSIATEDLKDRRVRSCIDKQLRDAWYGRRETGGVKTARARAVMLLIPYEPPPVHGKDW